MDDTPIAFDLPNSYTLEKRSSNTINIKTIRYERSTFTVVLDCMADESKLSPIIIFKLKNILRETFSNSIFIRVNAKGWINEDEMIQWVKNVWSRRTVDSSNPSSLLVLDSFRDHLVSSVKQKLHKKATNIIVIPDELISKLQPLNVSINKSFKSNVSIIN